MSHYLGHSDPTLPSQLLLSLLAGVRVREVGVEVLVQDLGRLFAEQRPKLINSIYVEIADFLLRIDTSENFL